MPVEIVHPVTAADIEPWVRGLLRGLLHDPYDGLAERVERMRRRAHPDRVWGARDGDDWVGTLATQERFLTVPGVGTETEDVRVDALTGVTVSPTRRRRGVLTAMLRDSLRAARERGDAMSVLIAAEWPIYGRFGYAPSTQVASYAFRPRERGATPLAGGTAQLRHIEPDEVRDVAAGVFAAARRRHPGQMDRSAAWWEEVLEPEITRSSRAQNRTWVLHTGAGGPDGLLAWRPTRDSDLTGRLGLVEVSDLFAGTDAAYQDLWAYLAGIDLVSEITLTERALDEPIRWLLPDGRALQQTAAADFLWVRLLDVPTALSARRYASPGELVLDVVDDDGDRYGAGRIRLVADGANVECVPTQDDADLRLTQRALASSYLGGFRLRGRAILGDVDELRAGAVARFDAMFAAPVLPWNQTWF